MELLLLPLAFVCEFLDSTLGMGYGTTLAPILLLMGYEPLQVVPALLFSEFVTGITAAHLHHTVGNVDFGSGGTDRKVACLLVAMTVIGVLVSVRIAIVLPPVYVKTIISAIVMSMGIVVISSATMTPRFSWPAIGVLGVVAAFCKGISGGGYGPIMVGGQVFSGTKIKSAVAITSLAEGFACLLAVILYFTMRPSIDFGLVPWLMAGAVLSVPFSVHTLKRLSDRQARSIVAVVMLLLGFAMIWKMF